MHDTIIVHKYHVKVMYYKNKPEGQMIPHTLLTHSCKL